MTNVMLALTTAMAAFGASLVGSADVGPDVVLPPDLPTADVGGTYELDAGDATATGGAHLGDGGANAYTDATSEHADGSGSLDVTGVDVPDLPAP